MAAGIYVSRISLRRSYRLARRSEPGRRPGGAPVYGLSLIHIWPEVSFCAKEVLRQLPEADAVLSGEGEESFPALLRALDAGAPLGGVPGLWFREGGEIQAAVPAGPVPMESLPFPYPELLSGDAASLSGKILYFETSRGCPFSCS